MFDEKLQKFLNTNEVCLGGITRLQDVGAETLEEAWDKASDEDLIWAVTRPGVMNPEQRRLFLVMVLESIEYKLTDPRSKNILEKLRTNEPITDEDLAAAWDASNFARVVSDFSDAASDAAWAAARTVRAAARTVRAAARDVVKAARAMWAASDAVRAAGFDGASAAAWAAQAKWVRENFKLCDLRTN